MTGSMKALVAAAAVLTGGFVATAPAEAEAGWGYYYSAPSYYYHAPVYSSYYGYGYGYPGYAPPVYGGYGGYGYGGYSAGYAPVYSGSYYSGYAPAYGGYGYAPYGYGRHGKVEYDVYTPWGKQEVEYKYHRNGTVTVDIDD